MGSGASILVQNKVCPSLPLCPEQKYKDVESSLKIEEVDGLELVRKFSEDMENMLRRKVEAVKVCQPTTQPHLLSPCSQGFPEGVAGLISPFRDHTGFGWSDSWWEEWGPVPLKPHCTYWFTSTRIL